MSDFLHDFDLMRRRTTEINGLPKLVKVWHINMDVIRDCGSQHASSMQGPVPSPLSPASLSDPPSSDHCNHEPSVEERALFGTFSSPQYSSLLDLLYPQLGILH